MNRLIYPIALVVTIFLASTQSEVALPSAVKPHDKLQHFFLFGLLATTLFRVPFFYQKPLLTILIITAFGISDELHQIFVPHRNFDLLDFWADVLGATIAVLAYKFIPLYRNILELNLAKPFKSYNTRTSSP